jgi:hypothetical protein
VVFTFLTLTRFCGYLGQHPYKPYLPEVGIFISEFSETTRRCPRARHQELAMQKLDTVNVSFLHGEFFGFMDSEGVVRKTLEKVWQR